MSGVDAPGRWLPPSLKHLNPLLTLGAGGREPSRDLRPGATHAPRDPLGDIRATPAQAASLGILVRKVDPVTAPPVGSWVTG